MVVTVDYRLGPLGFLALDELPQLTGATGGANGIRDVVMALEFVWEHISDFGGDPSAVTLAGQSAGAIIASILVTAPVAAGLLSRVVLESGVVTSPVWTGSPMEQGLAIGAGVLQALGVADLANVAEDVLSL